MRRKIFLSFGTLNVLLVWLWSGFLFADPSSVNFTLAEEQASGGGGFSLSSQNYVLTEDLIGSSDKVTSASANYIMQNAIGIGSNPVPKIQSISPSDYSRTFTDENPSFTVNAIDPDGDSLEYQVKMDDTVKAAFQSSNVLSFSVSGSDKGRHVLTFQVRDNDGTVNLNQANYMVRRPVK